MHEMESVAKSWLRCTRCGFASYEPSAFIASRGRLGAVERFCRQCWRERFRRKNSRIILLIAFIIVLGVAVLALTPSGRETGALIGLAWLEINLAFMMLLAPVNTALHEWAHACAARAVGMRVFRVNIGYGEPLYRTMIDGIDLRINRLLFLGGLTHAGHLTPSFLRTRQAAYVAAGPTSNLLLAWLLDFVIGQPSLTESLAQLVQGPVFLQAWLIGNLGIGAVSLFPMRVSTAAGTYFTDGAQLLGLLRAKPEYVENSLLNQWLLASSFAAQEEDFALAERSAMRGLERDPSHPALLNNLGIARLGMRDFKAGRDAFLKALSPRQGAAPPVNPIQVAESLNNIAYADLLMGGAAYLREADEHSRTACRLVPREPGYEETRGCVLVELRRYEEGRALLAGATRHVHGAEALSIHHAYLALANARLGDTAAATAHARIAMMDNSDHPIVLRALGRLDETDPPLEEEIAATGDGSASDVAGVVHTEVEPDVRAAPWRIVALGFLVAPLASGALQSIITLTPAAGLFTLTFTYPVALILGLPGYLIFRRLRWFKLWQVVLAGASLGAALSATLFWGTWPNGFAVGILMMAGIVILHGMAVSATFWWIAIRNPHASRMMR